MKRQTSRMSSVIACMTVSLCAGIIYLWSAFYRPVAEAFQMSDAAAGIVSSFLLLAFVFGCIGGGCLANARGPRFATELGIGLIGLGFALSGALNPRCAKLIYVTYALLGGLGSGLAYTACIACIQRWFANRPGFASGLAAAAFGFSSVIFAPLFRWVMNCFTAAETGLVEFRFVFPLLGALFLLVGLAASRFVRLPEGAAKTAAVAAAPRSVFPDTMSPLQIMKKSEFWLIFFTIFFGAATWTLILPYISDFGVARGLSLRAATLTLSLTGAFNAVGRISLAALSDRIGRSKTVVIFSVLTMAGALCVTVAGGVWYSAAILLIAFAYGGPGPMAAAFAVDFFGARNSGRNFGLITVSLGCSSLVCNAISAVLLHGSPVATFLMAAGLSVIPIGLMLLLRRGRSCKSETVTCTDAKAA